jgi:tetratricopeptide (TPR) repeat protein
MEDRAARISAEVDRADVDYAAGDVEGAVARLRSLATPDGDPDLEWRLSLRIGQYLLGGGDPANAHQELAHAASLARQTGDPARVVKSIIQLSWARVQSPDPQHMRAAVADPLDVASNMPESMGDRADEIQGLLGLGHANLGVFGAGVNFLRQAVELADRLSSDYIATWTGDLGIALLEVGEVEEAMNYLSEAMRLERIHETGNLQTWQNALRVAQSKRATGPRDPLQAPSAYAFNALAIRVSMTPPSVTRSTC